MDTFCHQSPITTNTQGEIINLKNERQISSNIMAETIKVFNGLTIQSTINDSTFYDSEEDDTESDLNRNPKVATHTTNIYYTHKLLTNRLIPDIIPVAIPPIEQTIAEDAAGSVETLHARLTIILKEIVTNALRSAAHVLQSHADVIRNDMDGTTPWDGNNDIGSNRVTSPVRICGSTTGSQSRTGNQYITSPRGSIRPQ